MDPVMGGIIGSIIVAVAIIVGNFIAVRLRKSAKKERKEFLEEIPKTLESLKEEAVKRYGFAYEVKYAKSKGIIENLEGRVRIIREYRGLGVIEEGMVLPDIVEEAWVSAPGKIDCKPKLISQVEKSDFHKQISLVVEDHSERNCKFRVEIEGGLTKEDGDINYGYEYTHSKGVCMTEEEAEEAYAKDNFKKEYICFDVRFPINKLELEVEFVEGYNVKVYPGVFLGGSETWNDLELQRIKEGIERTSRGACLKIDNPVLGFRYLLFWVPLARSEVEILKIK